MSRSRGLSRWLGFPQHYFRLTMLLLQDPRVPWYLKLLPLTALAYLFLPDFPTPVDDVLAFLVGMYLFVRLSPREVVEEYLQAERGG